MLYGEPPVKAQCLPFRQIPHTSRLFADFLSWASPVHQFFPRPPNFSQWLNDEATRLRYDSATRARVSSVLERQNREWNASAKTLENISRLRAGAAAVVTGQQVGLFGGPVFAIYKALTAAKLAAEATSAGIDAVPVFWLASEDHDLAEVNHVSVAAQDFSLQELRTQAAGNPDAPVGQVHFDDEIGNIIDQASKILGETDILGALRESYRPGSNFGEAFARLFARVFADYGIILLEPSAPELHRIAEPILRSSLDRVTELNEALLARGKE